MSGLGSLDTVLRFGYCLDSESGFWSLIYPARALGGAVELGVVTEGLREVRGEEQLRRENAH